MNYVFRFRAITQEPFDEEALRDITETDPVGLLKKCRKRVGDLNKGTRRLQWQLWTACYAGALGIRQQPNLFTTLLEDDYFDQRIYKADLDDLLRLALLIGTDADTTGRTYKNACAIAKRLQPLFDANIEPMTVLKRIEAAGGLKHLDISDLVATEEQPDDGDQDDDGGNDEQGVGSSDDDDGEDAGPDDDDDEDSDDEDDSDDDELSDDDVGEEEPPTASSRSTATPRACYEPLGWVLRLGL